MPFAATVPICWPAITRYRRELPPISLTKSALFIEIFAALCRSAFGKDLSHFDCVLESLLHWLHRTDQGKDESLTPEVGGIPHLDAVTSRQIVVKISRNRQDQPSRLGMDAQAARL